MAGPAEEAHTQDNGRSAAGPEVVSSDHHAELWREGLTMALYVTICLLAALSATGDDEYETLAVVWGTTVGLALAHWVAFRMAARMVGRGAVDAHYAASSLAQVAGAATVALIGSLPVLALPDSAERDVLRLMLVAVLGGAGFATARASGGSRAGAGLYALVVAALGLGTALAKNVLLGH
jgi:hypothetical protein